MEFGVDGLKKIDSENGGYIKVLFVVAMEYVSA